MVVFYSSESCWGANKSLKPHCRQLTLAEETLATERIQRNEAGSFTEIYLPTTGSFNKYHLVAGITSFGC